MMELILESPLVAGGIAALVLLVLAWLLLRRRSGRSGSPRGKKSTDHSERRLEGVDTVTGWPPTATRMLSQSERKAMALLRDALPDYMILAQVSLARFLKVPERYSYSDWMRRVGHATVDFLVCDLSANVIAAVELRDADHLESDKARKRHNRMDRVLSAAGIKVFVWREASLPQMTAARDMILGAVATQAQATGAQARSNARQPEPAQQAEPVDEYIEVRDPPASTWFDDIQPTRPASLDPSVRQH